MNGEDIKCIEQTIKILTELMSEVANQQRKFVIDCEDYSEADDIEKDVEKLYDGADRFRYIYRLIMEKRDGLRESIEMSGFGDNFDKERLRLYEYVRSNKVYRQISEKHRITEQRVHGDYMFCYEYAIAYKNHVTWYIAFSSVSGDRDEAANLIVQEARLRGRKL